MSPVLHYYKIKGFERDYIQILGFLTKKSVRPTILTLFSSVKRRLVFSIKERHFYEPYDETGKGKRNFKRKTTGRPYFQIKTVLLTLW